MENGFVKGFLAPVLKATLFAVIITLVLVLLLALVVKLTTFSFLAVKICNQFIKVVSLIGGAFIFIKEDKGLLKGLFYGALYFLTISLIFFLISGTSNFSFLDLIFNLVIGLISGIIAVNLSSRGK